MRMRQQKSKVKFTESQSIRKGGTPPASEYVAANASRRKSRKLKSTVVDETSPLIGDSEEDQEETPDQIPLAHPDGDKNASDGSLSDEEVPKIKWPPDVSATSSKFPFNGSKINFARTAKCTRTLFSSQKITPCVRGENQGLSTTDYASSALPSFMPPLLHPINGQVSVLSSLIYNLETFTKHREFTDYLRQSGFLKLFGACVLQVYRMWKWPPQELLMEQMLNAMGYEIPSRRQVMELNKVKQSLLQKLKLLARDRSKLMEKLDEYQDSAVRYSLLDQDEILPPRPDRSYLNLELMRAIFKHMKFIAASRVGESTDLKVIMPKSDPVFYVLPIPPCDKRMLQ